MRTPKTSSAAVPAASSTRHPQLDPERGAVGLVGFDAYLAFHGADEVLDDGQTEPRAAHVAGTARVDAALLRRVLDRVVEEVQEDRFEGCLLERGLFGERLKPPRPRWTSGVG